MKRSEVLLAKENNAIINSLNLVIFNQLADILKNKFPATYRVQSAVQTCFGALALPRSRGEGGGSDLFKRIGICFYNQIS